MAERSVLDADVEASERPHPPSLLERAALAVGSAALLGAMATDALAVAGRHLGVALLGSIEIVQACIVVAATSALVFATALGAHAQVRILLEKITPARARLLGRFGDGLSALVFLWLAAGSGWLASDLWGGAEQTELLGIPLRWLRLLWIGGALVIAALFALRAVRSVPE